MYHTQRPATSSTNASEHPQGLCWVQLAFFGDPPSVVLQKTMHAAVEAAIVIARQTDRLASVDKHGCAAGTHSTTCRDERVMCTCLLTQQHSRLSHPAASTKNQCSILTAAPSNRSSLGMANGAGSSYLFLLSPRHRRKVHTADRMPKLTYWTDEIISEK